MQITQETPVKSCFYYFFYRFCKEILNKQQVRRVLPLLPFSAILLLLEL